ncbi:sigma-70 family RNA polymerase sigma factor [Ascidiimonas aurantiaca]|uniref:RNA polymerase sigma factor n=1 Tax=Ascidiimonas aurantiaca TaxID=1685432 RepID=UPI0030EB2C8A
MSLKQLIHQCKNGERKAQEQLYRLFGGKLYSICLKYSRNKTEAEDNLHDSFLTIFQKIEQFNFNGSFEGWMRRITVNTVLQKYRKEGVFDLIANEVAEEVEIEVDAEDISLQYLLNIIQELPNRYRLVFNMYVLDGYSHKEIGEMLLISEGTSKSNLARARMILKNKIEDHRAKKKINSL